MQKFIPESKQDTLMACFCLFLHGTETATKKRQMRQQLMDRFAKIIQREDCYTFASVQAFVNRLHSIRPLQIPRQAEQFFLRDQGHLMREATTFIVQNRRVGFVGDKFTFCYLFAELYSIDVHLYQPEQVILSVTPFARFHLHLCHDQGFYLLFEPKEIKPCPFKTPRGVLLKRPSRVRMPAFYLNGKPMIPPVVQEYRVHHLCIYQSSSEWYKIESADWPTDQYAYIYGQYEPHGELDLLTCVSKSGQTGAWFYLKRVPCAVYLVVGQGAEQSVQIESRFIIF